MPTMKRNSAGQAILDGIRADLKDRGLSLGPDEEALLIAAADAADDVHAYRRRIREDGMVAVNEKSGAIKAHPLIPLVATRAAQLDRMLARLGKVIADPEPEPDLTPVALAKSSARVRAGQASAASRAKRGIRT